MPEYRRWRQVGGTYFFTVNLKDRRKRSLVEHIRHLRRAFAAVREARPFKIDAAVALPEHLHMIWTLPAGDDDFSTRWRLVKSRFARRIGRASHRRPSQIAKHESGVWQRRFYEHLIRDEDDFAAHVDDIHYNPVKHGHVNRPIDWPYSSLHLFVRRGILDAHWGTSGIETKLEVE
ncbi:MAG: transposase [Planctomycetes bacterium]|nr:transposase [Planctomycetota bacterium]